MTVAQKRPRLFGKGKGLLDYNWREPGRDEDFFIFIAPQPFEKARFAK